MISLKRPWGSIATEFVAAKKSPETLKAFMNTVLAELWEENHEVPTDARALWNRCEPFEAEAPDGVALITAGVDVQADRLEVEIVGWGGDEESWSIAHHVIPGDVMRNEVWDHLEGLLLAEHLHDSGQTLRIVAAVHRLRVQGCDGAAVHARPLCAPRVRGIRWIGDRKGIEEQTTRWDRVIMNREHEMGEWIHVIRQMLKRRIQIMGYFNNHFAGFAPGSIELFDRMWKKYGTRRLGPSAST